MNDPSECPCCSLESFLPMYLLNDSQQEDASIHADLLGENEGGDDDAVPHPTDALATLQREAEDKNETLVIVDTHGHAHLDRDPDEEYLLLENNNSATNNQTTPVVLKTITCAVAPKDWKDTLAFCSKSKDRFPALGVHPWYIAELEAMQSTWLQELEDLLLLHPSALVGEIGLCKMAKFVRNHPEGKGVALQMQRDVFEQQFSLAARMRRPVSVHCVNQHGVFLTVLKELVHNNEKDPESCLPPTIGMHSFTGTAHHVQELLKFETNLKLPQPLFYFGFSHSVNVAMCTSSKARRKGREAVCKVPYDRIMVESDVHSSNDLVGGTVGAIGYVASCRNTTLLDVARMTSKNATAFVTQREIRKTL